MKRLICLITALCIILGSFSFCFADFGSSDSTNLYNLSQYTLSIKNLLNQSMPTFNQVKTISDNVSNIYTRLNTLNTINTSITSLGSKLDSIAGYLHNGSDSISSLVNSILSWMSPIYNSITNIPVDLTTIIGALGSFDTNNNYSPYLIGLKDLRDTFFNYYLYQSSLDANLRRHNSHTNWVNEYGNYSLPNLDSNFNWNYTTYAFQNGSPLGNIGMILYRLTNNDGIGIYRTLFNYGATQNAINWGNLGTSSFTPLSQTDGIYKWLSAIQAPVARLSYVLASDERIAAQQAAAPNEQAVVSNFIDSNGSGSAGVSDFANIASLSSGYKSNFNTQANASGMFNIFNQNNMGWFSQETLNQLDTTQTQARGLLKSSTPETPLLDQQIRDIYDQIGVKHD